MHVRRTLALALAVPLLLAGCSEDPEPRPKMPDPTPTSSEPSPTESETAEAESPEEFIRRWVEEDRRMFATGETKAFLEMGRDCDDCRRIAQTVDRIYGAGGTVEWDGWTIRQISRRGKPSAHTYRFVVNSAPTRYRESPTGPWKTLDGGRVIQLIVLRPDASSWQVLQSRELSE